MKPLEIYDKIINGNLRPNNFEQDGIKLEEEIKKLDISSEDIIEYINYLNKNGEKYKLTIQDHDTGEKLYEEEKNEKFNELIDFDIPPIPNKKGENYLELIEIEYVRNLKNIKDLVNEKTSTEIEECGNKLIVNLKNLWYELKYYEKLVKTGRYLDYKKDNDFVVMVLKTYLERTASEMILNFKPFLKAETIDNLYTCIFGERDRKIAKIEKIIERIEIRQKLKIDKKFDEIFEKLTAAKTIEEKLFNEIEFWKNHRSEKIEGITQEQLDFVARGMVEHLEGELRKAKVTGRIRGHKIEFGKAEKLHDYMKDIIKDYEKGEGTKTLVNNGFEMETYDANEKVTQRNKIREYLREHYPDIKENNTYNLSKIALELTDFFNPGIKSKNRINKKEVIRQELMLFKNEKLDL